MGWSVSEAKERAKSFGSQYGHRLGSWRLNNNEWESRCNRQGCRLVVGISLGDEHHRLGWGGGNLKEQCPGK